MNDDPKDDLDRAIDETLASMVSGEPRRVSAASVRQAMGESRSFRLPVWLAAAAVLVAGLGVTFLKDRAPVAPPPVSVARSTESPAPARVRVPSSPDSPPAARVSLGPPGTAGVPPPRKGLPSQTPTEPPYEGLPRLTIAAIDPPEPLSTVRLEADAILIPRIEIPPLPISSLSTEQEHK